MTNVLIILAAVLTVVVLAIAVSRRRRKPSGIAEDPGLGLTAHRGSEPEGLRPDDLVLVPLPNDTGQALVVGSEDALAVFDQSGLLERQTRGGSGPVPQLVRNAIATGGLAATEMFRRGANSGRIVAVAQESMKHLEKGTPVVDKAGNVLALVRGDNGQLSHVMRLDNTGAQVAAASNMATLAVTAALSQQLAAIADQLQELSDTLEQMVKEKDRERLAGALGANKILLEIAESVQRRGITEADYSQLAVVKLPVTSLQIETTAKLAEIAPDGIAKMTRGKRLDAVGVWYENGRLE